MDNPRVVIVGAGYAGVMAAIRSTKAAPDNTVVTLIDPRPSFVERIRLHQQIAGETIAHVPLEDLVGDQVEIVRRRVERVDPDARRVFLEDGRDVDYDALILAAGSTIDADRVPGASEHALKLGPNTAAKIRTLAEERGRLIVVGGGFTGIEAATEIAETHRSLHVTLLTSGKVGNTLSETGRRHVARALDRLGVDVIESTRIEEVFGDRVLTTDGRVVSGRTLWLAGFRPAAIAARCGLAVDERGCILTRDTLQALGRPEIFVAGDLAAVKSPTGAPYRMACATALPMGAHAANNAAALLRGEPPKPFGLGYLLQCLSLGRRDGLIQFTDRADRPVERVLTGRLAALVKERVVRYPLQMIRAERRWPVAVYSWPAAPRTEHTAQRAEAHS